MNKKVIKFLIGAFAYTAVLYPLWIRISGLSWAFDSELLYNLFPIFGLTAFSILWLHSISGVFEPWLRKYIDFDNFVHRTSLIVLVCIILHPLLLFIYLGSNFIDVFIYADKYIWFAVIGWVLLITYDIGKALKIRQPADNFFARNWNKILLISTIGFLFTFFHSLGLGHDLQSGVLRIVWIFYGTTAILATIYTYGIKRLFK